VDEPSFHYVHLRDAAEILAEFDRIMRARLAELEQLAGVASTMGGSGSVTQTYISTLHVREHADVVRRALETLDAHVEALRPVWSMLEATPTLADPSK
jgi:hypothetical protein